MKRYAKQKNGIIEFWYYANEVDVEIKRLQAQHQEDADLIAEQKREIEILHKVRDKAEEELNELKVDYDSLLEILADRCKKLS